MHYTIDYTSLEPLEAHKKALEDIKEYMGDEKFVQLTEEFRKFPQEQMPIDRFAMFVDVAGVRGYPVKAWYNHVYPL